MHVHMYIHRFCSHEKKKEQPYYKASELLPQETIALLMKIEVLACLCLHEFHALGFFFSS